MSVSTMSQSLVRPDRNQSLLLVLLATACWSTSGLFISLIARDAGFSPVAIAFWRDLLTFTVLLVGILLLKPELLKVTRRDLIWLGLMGSLSIGLFHVLWNSSILINGVAAATVIQSNAPIVVTVLAWFLWREPLTWRKIVAILLAVAGTAFISRLDGLLAQEIEVTGLLVGLGSAVTYALMSLFGKKLIGDYSSWTVLVYIFGFGALTLLPFQIAGGFPVPQSPTVVAYFAGLVAFTTVAGFGLYTFGLRGLQASVASIVAITEVPFAAIVAYIFLDQGLNWSQIVGAILVVGGVVLLSWSRRRKARRAAPPH